MGKVRQLFIILVLAIGVALSAGTAYAASTLPNGLTAKIVAVSGQTISGNIDATGYDVGIYVGPGVHDVRIVGATVSGANDEGILVQDTSDVLIKSSTITGNAVNPFSIEEVKGIALVGTTNIVVHNNTVQANHYGGIGVYDDGPNHPWSPNAISAPRASTGNLISANRVIDNGIYHCGIVVSAKNPGGGVSNNVVTRNTISGGLGGIIVAGGGFGPVSLTDNVVSHNVITNNLIPGISLHAFGPGVITGTQLIGNVLSYNGAGEVSKETTGIEIFAIPGVGTISKTQVLQETVTGDYYGVYHLGDTGTHVSQLTTAGATVAVGP